MKEIFQIKTSSKILFIILPLIFIAACEDKNNNIEPEQQDECTTINHAYTTDIKPILINRCSLPGCHASGSSFGDYTVYSGIKAKVDAGTFKERVLVKKDMPPGNPLSPGDIKKIECWINEGAPEN